MTPPPPCRTLVSINNRNYVNTIIAFFKKSAILFLGAIWRHLFWTYNIQSWAPASKLQNMNKIHLVNTVLVTWTSIHTKRGIPMAFWNISMFQETIYEYMQRHRNHVINCFSMTIPCRTSVFTFRGAANLKIHQNLETYFPPTEFFLRRKKCKLKEPNTTHWRI
jgi:hypothetical protein